MKKYSKKQNLANNPSFEKEIELFLSKIDFNVDKKMLKGVLECLFDTLGNEFNVDMWALKTHTKENMDKVEISALSNLDQAKWAGCYERFWNEIEIKKPEKYRDFILCGTIVHELTHCLSSLRVVDFSKIPYGQKQLDVEAHTGFVGGKYEGFDQELVVHYSYGSTFITEGITELIASKTIKNYFGNNINTTYALPKKFTCQLYSICGNKLIQSYFDNDYRLFNDLIEYKVSKNDNNENTKFKLATKDKPLMLNLMSLDTYFDIAHKAFEYYKLGDNLDEKQLQEASDVFYTFTMYNLTLFQNQLIKDFYNNRHKFLSGNEVKESLLKSFDLYAKNIRNHFSADEMYPDLWVDYTDIIDETYYIVGNIFTKLNKFTMPQISNKEMEKHIGIAQKLCKYNMWGTYELQKIDVNKMRYVNLQNQLEKYQKISDRNYKWNKIKPQVECEMNFDNSNC